MRIQTVDDLADALDNDLQWRKRELTTVNSMLESSLTPQRGPLLRAAVCLLYAHWEGFVKTAATCYVSFVAIRRLRYRELAPNFVALGLSREIRDAGKSDDPTSRTNLITKLTSDLSERADIDWQNSVNARSNLNSKTLREILALLGLDANRYLSKGSLLDKKLLENRNRVAHGERMEIDPDDYDLLHNEIIQIADWFSTDVQNAAVTGQYRQLPVA